MPVKSDREYRNLGTFEKRAEGEEKSFIVTGYASTFDPYLLFEEMGVKFYERIDPAAFNDADMSDVVFLRDHEGQVLARIKNGLVELKTDAHGLYTRTDLGKTEAARAMFEDIDVGNYSQMSFSFMTEPGTDIYEEQGDTVTRIITRFKKIYDVSAVAFPANPGTDIGVSFRSKFDGVIEKRTAERLKAERTREIIRLKAKMMKGRFYGN
jgi:HK97 family phage prohead protease